MDNNAVPPFKFSRESKIRIDRDGYFWHEGERVEHPGLARALASWIARDAETGRYILRNALDWCFITVDDAPLVVRGAHLAPGADGGVRLTLSDGSTEPLDVSTLRLGDDDVPYCDVKSGTLPARFSRAASFELLSHARPEGEGWVLDLGGRTVALRRA